MVNTFYVLNTFVCTPNCCYIRIWIQWRDNLYRDGYSSKDLDIVCFIKISLSCDYPFQIMDALRLMEGMTLFWVENRYAAAWKCNLCCFSFLNIYMKSWSKNRIDLLIANQQISQMYSTGEAKTNPRFLLSKVWLF